MIEEVRISARKFSALVATVVLVVGCGRGGGGAAAQPIGATGYAITVPAGWTVIEDQPQWFTLKRDGKPVGQLRLSKAAAPPTPAALADAACAGQADIVSAALGGGGVSVRCRGAKTSRVEVHRPGPDGQDFRCTWESDQPADIAALASACATIAPRS